MKTPLLVCALMLMTCLGSTMAADLDRQVLADTMLGEFKSAPDADARRSRLQQELALQDAIVKEAGRLKLTERIEVQARIELARRQIVVEAYWADFLKKNPVTDSSLRSSYDKLKADTGSRQYHLSHILVQSEAAAQQVQNELIQQKKPFAEVARILSADASSKTQGGDLGWHWRTGIAPWVVEKLAGPS
jgi:peptidyl-prolyl cis-trans isomerase C